MQIQFQIQVINFSYKYMAPDGRTGNILAENDKQAQRKACLAHKCENPISQYHPDDFKILKRSLS